MELLGNSVVPPCPRTWWQCQVAFGRTLGCCCSSGSSWSRDEMIWMAAGLSLRFSCPAARWCWGRAHLCHTCLIRASRFIWTRTVDMFRAAQLHTLIQRPRAEILSPLTIQVRFHSRASCSSGKLGIRALPVRSLVLLQLLPFCRVCKSCCEPKGVQRTLGQV